MFFITIDGILVEKVLDINGDEEDALKDWVGPLISSEEILIDADTMDWTTLVIWLDIKGGRISLATIVEVEVVRALDLDTSEVPTMMAQWIGKLSM
jgi:hypothetical protein